MVRLQRWIDWEGSKHDPDKPRIAARLRRVFAALERLRPRRRETTLTVGWIAARLGLGTRKSASTRRQEWKQSATTRLIGS